MIILAAAAAITLHHRPRAVYAGRERLVAHVTRNPDAGGRPEVDYTLPHRDRLYAVYVPWEHQLGNYTRHALRVAP